jgi:hypothetical protein
MYDISGMHREAALHAIEQDWPHLTGDLHLTDSPAYIFDRGKPVVAVWELGFKDRVIAPDQAAAIIRYLRERSCHGSGPHPVLRAQIWARSAHQAAVGAGWLPSLPFEERRFSLHSIHH